jgi:NAD(P)-dependent dehydrogenase (short-subunit alcohol dehydrogenase family)
MAKTVLITGASSGIGKETALLFAQRGWQVSATMRSPEQAVDLHQLANVVCLRLDVTDPHSIQSAVRQTLEQFSRLDVVVNNAGYGLTGSFEGATPAQIQRQFDTNVFGLMNVCREVLPHLRQQRSGVIVNVASVGGRITFPLYSLYHATKWAVEGFSESLQYELRPLGIRVKIIEPGPIKTDFYTRSSDSAQQEGLADYEGFASKVMPKIKRAGDNGASPQAVAKVIYRASTDNSWRLRYPADPIAAQLLFLRKLLPDSWFTSFVRANLT